MHVLRAALNKQLQHMILLLHQIREILPKINFIQQLLRPLVLLIGQLHKNPLKGVKHRHKLVRNVPFHGLVRNRVLILSLRNKVQLLLELLVLLVDLAHVDPVLLANLQRLLVLLRRLALLVLLVLLLLVVQNRVQLPLNLDLLLQQLLLDLHVVDLDEPLVLRDVQVVFLNLFRDVEHPLQDFHGPVRVALVQHHVLEIEADQPLDEVHQLQDQLARKLVYLSEFLEVSHDRLCQVDDPIDQLLDFGERKLVFSEVEPEERDDFAQRCVEHVEELVGLLAVEFSSFAGFAGGETVRVGGCLILDDEVADFHDQHAFVAGVKLFDGANLLGKLENG